MPPEHRFVIAACARWEAGYVVEWLNYHRAIGFDHVYLYCNDDSPHALFESVLPFTQGNSPFVTFRFFPRQGEQREMLLHFLQNDRHAAEWISFLDLDEFIRLPEHQSIGQFIASFGPAVDCVMFNWVFFGPNGHVAPPAQGVLQAYTRREAVLHPFTKHVTRSHIFDDPKLVSNTTDASFIHRVAEYLEKPARCVNVLGEDMTHYYEDFPEAAAAFVRHPPRQAQIFDLAVVHHYAFRSERAFHDRAARGLKGGFARQIIWFELADGPNFHNYLAEVNEIEDRRLADFWQYLIGQSEQTLVQPDPPALDLGAIMIIREVRLRARPGESQLCLSVSIEGTVWVELAREMPAMEGGFGWRGPGAAWARFVRVASPEGQAIPADRIQIVA